MSKTVKQSVIVKKDGVESRSQAVKIAGKYADRIYTSRETGSSWRFRQRPPSDFKKGTLKTVKINPHVSLVVGKLK